MTDLKTPWSGHWREGEFLGFVRWALGREDLRSQYRDATGDAFEPSADGSRADFQIGSGEALAYIHRYAEWLALNVFGTPDNTKDDGKIVVGRTTH